MFPRERSIYRRHSYSKSGFTVIEMILTIGIVLTLLLLAVFAQGRVTEQARKNKCLANLRAIGQAQALYIADNNGWFVPNRTEYPGVGTGFWCQELLLYLSGEKVAFPTIGEHDVFACPEARGPFSPSYQVGYNPEYVRKLSYAQNIYLGGGLRAEAYGYPKRQKLSAVSKPAEMVMVVEANRVNVRAEAFEGDASGMGATYRHSKEINLLFVDGHVESSRYPVTREKGNVRFNWRIEDENL